MSFAIVAVQEPTPSSSKESENCLRALLAAQTGSLCSIPKRYRNVVYVSEYLTRLVGANAFVGNFAGQCMQLPAGTEAPQEPRDCDSGVV